MLVGNWTGRGRKKRCHKEGEKDRKKRAFWMLMSRDLDITKGQSSGKNEKCLHNILVLTVFLIISAVRWSPSW